MLFSHLTFPVKFLPQLQVYSLPLSIPHALVSKHLSLLFYLQFRFSVAYLLGSSHTQSSMSSLEFLDTLLPFSISFLPELLWVLY